MLFVFTVLLSGCGMIAINENDYRFLPEEYHKYIKPFDIRLVTRQVNYHDSLYLYKINTPDIKAVLKQHKYV